MIIKNFSKKTIALSAVIVSLLFLLLFGVDYYYKNLLIKAERLRYHDKALVSARSLSNIINSRLALLLGLKNFTKTIIIPENKTKDKSSFDFFAAGLYSSAKGIRNFVVAPKGVNTFVYPIESNKKAVGHNLLKDERPNVQADVQRAILTRRMVLSGPYELRQGGLGLVSRMAVFKDDVFWGFVSMVLDMQPILNEANISSPMNGCKFALIGNDGIVFKGDESVLNTHPVLVTIPLPDGKWELAISPKLGWGNSYFLHLYIWRVLALVFSSTIFLFIYSMLMQQNRLEQLVLKKTKEIGESEARLDFALQVSRIGAWDLNLQNHATTRTLLHDQIFGYEELQPVWTYEMFLEHVLPEDRVTTDLIFQKAIATRTALAFDCRIHRVDGEVRWIHVAGDHKLDFNGENLTMTGILRDITEFKQAELALKQSEERFTYAINATQDGLFDWDLSTNVIYYSLRWKNMFGYAYDELSNDFSAWKDLMSPEDAEAVWNMLEQLINKKRDRFKIEFKMKHKDGHWVNILSKATAIFNEDGQAVRVVGTNSDISERVDMEHKLAMAQRLEAVGQLASGIAHEINTPLQYILGNLTFMRDSWSEIEEDLKSPKQLEGRIFIDSVPVEDTSLQLALEWKKSILDSIEGVGQISKIVQAMKLFAHPDIESVQLTDFNELVKNTVVIAKNEWKYVAEVVMNLDEDLPYIVCNSGEINQTILILLVNAAHAIAMNNGNKPEKGRITLTTFQENGNVALSVQDNGCGISTQNINRVFDHFFTTKEVGKGTGQGLAIAHTIITKHKGSIVLDSQEGIGATFTIKLPLKVD
ncbi:PAS domain S-box-containing protein [Maridesulfovibrio ferrireducens]|uniref:histidine kinase n=1 Tax=Maridesulfovibrio ferrireducens TaxID=246191 RepID=A0A1G9FY48_9BACT|nr:PAS domain-containing protein [Maridesulfovibrio ferrireducens]SDK93083.1 PAS domain S-box-containing protein [Maridesulfovibrio ferrireducens]